MLKKFAILDSGNHNKNVGVLLYDEPSKKFHVIIDGAADVGALPMSLFVYANNGKFDLSAEESYEWASGRVCPSGRQNIAHILRDLNLKEYDVFGILEYAKGRCDKDELYLAETT